jgi:hypothetical protein
MEICSCQAYREIVALYGVEAWLDRRPVVSNENAVKIARVKAEEKLEREN